MGVVYLAQDPAGVEVAIKALLPAIRADPRRLARFEREIQALLRLRHPNVVQIVDVGQESSGPWFASRLIPGDSLQTHLDQKGPLPIPAAIELGVQLADALSTVHAADLVHRDLKPDNVQLGPEGAVLTDFGLIRDLEISESLRLSRTGAVSGTPGYWSPEQATGAEAGPLSDVYSLGATLYAALTGGQPFHAANFLEAVIMTREGRPQNPRRVRPEIPPWLEKVVLRCLEKDPSARFPSAAALSQALTQGSPRGPRAPFALGALAVVMLAGAAAFAALRPSPTEVHVSSPTPSPLATTPEKASPLVNRGLRLLRHWQPESAIEAFQEAAEGGSPEGCFWLGVCLTHGYGVSEPDLRGGSQWLARGLGADPQNSPASLLREAAQKGHREAALVLGQWLDQGRAGMEADPVEALSWTRQAAKAGHPYGLFRLAYCLDDGRGVPEDDEQALGLYRRAFAADEDSRTLVRLARLSRKLELPRADDLFAQAHGLLEVESEGGSARAAYDLASLTLQGEGVAQDRRQAERLYRLSAERGYPAALGVLGNGYFSGAFGAGDLEAAVRWWRRGAERGDRASLSRFARAHQQGLGVPRDYEGARALYEQAAQRGNRAAAASLAELHLTVVPDPAKAYGWALKAARWGHPKGMFLVATLLESGAGCTKDEAEAIRWLKLATRSGSARAPVALARRHEQGRGVAQSRERAQALYDLAAQRGDMDGMWRLARLLSEGEESGPELERARDLLERAIRLGSPDAHWVLSDLVSHERAVALLHSGSELGALPAKRRLADRYRLGQGVEVDLEQAERLYRSAASGGNGRAMAELGTTLSATDSRAGLADAGRGFLERALQVTDPERELAPPSASYQLGLLLLEGRGGPADLPRARTLLRAAAEAGHPAAKTRLAQLEDE